MSQDTAPRHRYAVTFEVIIYVEAETEDQAEDYAEEQFCDAVDPELCPLWRVADVEREGA